MRYFLGFLVSIGLIIVLIFLLFHGGGKAKVPSTAKTLESYATTNAEVRMTIDAPVNSQEQHQDILVTVNSDQVTFEQQSGYDGQVVNQQQFASNDNAFQVFLRALDYAGFTNGDTDKSLSDERGYCPLGDRYIFELIQNGQDVERYWATSCSNPKTYKGNLDLTVTLFQNQVPQYGSLTSGVAL
jgi:hypothetical protein